VSNCKYIIMEEYYTGITTLDSFPFIFPSVISHDLEAHRRGYPERKVIAAGFCCPADMAINPIVIDGVEHRKEEDKLTGRIHTLRWICWGRSDSLGIATRGDVDAQILNKFFR